MQNLHHVTFVLIFIAGVLLQSSLSSSLVSNVHSSSDTELTVELAIFVDKDFGQVFKHDRTQILNYLQAVLYDVHLRFKTLPYHDVSFRVTVLQVFENAEQQPFLEQNKNDNGTFPFLPQVLFSFQRWIYQQVPKLPSFDVALALLGTDQVDDIGLGGVANSYTICQGIDPKMQLWNSAVVIMMRNISPATVLAHEIAHVLGARHDDDPTLTDSICKGSNIKYIMDSEATAATKPHFFSKCSQHWISQTLSQIPNETFCLNANNNSSSKPILDTAMILRNSSLVGTLSIQEQCQILVNNSSAFVAPEDESCWFSKCQPASNVEPRYFQPFDGTFCNNGSGRCFRGECFPLYNAALQLENVASAKCLSSMHDIFSVNDHAVLHDCLVQPLSPLIIVKAKKGVKLLMGYSTEDGVKDKCLTVDKLSVKFVPCHDSYQFEWEFRNVRKSTSKVFVLYHLLTKTCVQLDEKLSTLVATPDCFAKEETTLWKLVNPTERINNTEYSGGFKTKPLNFYLLVLSYFSYYIYRIW